jgi:EAL domain-containing protein (putative c-di-GMP-specific phosphodiesterase class I)
MAFSVIAVLRHRNDIDLTEFIGLIGLQAVLITGSIIRAFVTNYMVMNTFCLMAILVIFLSFQNPDLFLNEHGYVFNLTAFRALLLERNRKKRPCRLISFVVLNYNEHREIFGGQQMDEAMTKINRYLAETFPNYCSFYLRNGCYAITGSDRMNIDEVCRTLEKRFTDTWKTMAGELLLNISFLRADTEVHDFPVERLINTLLISLDEAGQKSGDEGDLILSDSMQAISERLNIRRCLEQALEQNTLEVFLQPIVDSATGKRIAAEALVRLRDDNGGIIRPDLFITLAEQEGFIIKLGEQVLSKVCEFIRDHDLDEMGIRWINVNLSPNQFMSRNVPERFESILKEYGVSPDRIHLELTEQSMIDFSLMQDQIRGLHETGFKFALDDYGSGYSNLTRVRQYPFCNIKIDMEVVWNYCRDRDPLLPALLQAFKQMSFSITAEGIETAEMADALREIGCDYFQGYYFSRPVPMDEFLQMAG